jgi:thiamine-monophosphate kinase
MEVLEKLMKHGNPGEDAILKRIFAGAANTTQKVDRGRLSLGIGDDAALFRPQAGHETILTCDWFLEGTHFLRGKHPPDAVGWKCLARAVSDLAAMGGTPRCFLLSLALPQSRTGPWLDQFLRGLRRASSKFDCILAGGDTTRWREILINVTVVGEVPTGRAVRRSGARAGDILCVSGRLGEAELGLRVLRTSRGHPHAKNLRTKKQLYPEPRLALGQWLSKTGLATAMMDLSDGLSSDLPRLCAASGVGARVGSARLPGVRGSDSHGKLGTGALQLSLDGGDDYELLFTVPQDKIRMLPKSYKGVALTAIGKITASPGRMVLAENSRERRLLPGGWDPFRAKRQRSRPRHPRKRRTAT